MSSIKPDDCVNFFQQLPEAVQQLMSKFLPPASIANSSLVDAMAKRIFNDNNVWKTVASQLNIKLTDPTRARQEVAQYITLLKDTNSIALRCLPTTAQAEILSIKDPFQQNQALSKVFSDFSYDPTFKQNAQRLLTSLSNQTDPAKLKSAILMFKDDVIQSWPIGFQAAILNDLFTAALKNESAALYAVYIEGEKRLSPSPEEFLATQLSNQIVGGNAKFVVCLLDNLNVQPTTDHLYQALTLALQNSRFSNIDNDLKIVNALLEKIEFTGDSKNQLIQEMQDEFNTLKAQLDHQLEQAVGYEYTALHTQLSKLNTTFEVLMKAM